MRTGVMSPAELLVPQAGSPAPSGAAAGQCSSPPPNDSRTGGPKPNELRVLAYSWPLLTHCQDRDCGDGDHRHKGDQNHGDRRAHDLFF